MRLENNLDKILIIDFGSQFTQLIARKVRELNVFCEIISHNKLKDYKTEKKCERHHFIRWSLKCLSK